MSEVTDLWLALYGNPEPRPDRELDECWAALQGEEISFFVVVHRPEGVAIVRATKTGVRDTNPTYFLMRHEEAVWVWGKAPLSEWPKGAHGYFSPLYRFSTLAEAAGRAHEAIQTKLGDTRRSLAHARDEVTKWVGKVRDYEVEENILTAVLAGLEEKSRG